MAKNKIYVVTNSTISGNYTPNVYKDENSAWSCFFDLGISDAIDAFEDDMQEILTQKIASNAKEIIADIKKYIENYKKEPEIVVENDLSEDKENEYIEGAKKIIEKFNISMEEGEVPFRFNDEGEESADYIYDFEWFIDELESESLDLRDLVEGNEKDYLEFFEEHISGIEFNSRKILLTYGDDNFNCIEFFETDIIK